MSRRWCACGRGSAALGAVGEACPGRGVGGGRDTFPAPRPAGLGPHQILLSAEPCGGGSPCFSPRRKSSRSLLPNQMHLVPHHASSGEGGPGCPPTCSAHGTPLHRRPDLTFILPKRLDTFSRGEKSQLYFARLGCPPHACVPCRAPAGGSVWTPGRVRPGLWAFLPPLARSREESSPPSSPCTAQPPAARPDSRRRSTTGPQLSAFTLRCGRSQDLGDEIANLVALQPRVS